MEWPLKNLIGKATTLTDAQKEQVIREAADRIIPALTSEAEKIPIGSTHIVATDWMNGRRTPDANQLLEGSIMGLTLGSSAPMIFRALVEATAFGSKAIVDRFISEGVKIDAIIGIGGISKKSPFVMQTLADVLNMPIKVARSEQACAFGAAMFAAVVAGVYPDVAAAQKTMGQGFEQEFQPIPENVEKYKPLYQAYLKLGAFTESL